MAILHLRPSSRDRLSHRSPSLFSSVCFLGFLTLLGMLVIKVHDFAYQTRTVAGHNLKPTPWHPFEPKVFDEGTRYSQATKILQCQYLQCLSNPKPGTPPLNLSKLSHCPAFFRWIHMDLKPWSKSGIGVTHLEETKPYAAFRITIVGGRLYVDLYYDCVQSRMMFTVWGLLQLLKRYPGMIPDVDMMFDCMDRPRINRIEHISKPLPLFRYCTTAGHFDIPFPDWSFWGWPEVNIKPWDLEFQDIERGSHLRSWKHRWPYAYWKGNPDVLSLTRMELLRCNDTKQWRAQIFRQNWGEEAKAGFKQSKLSSQCNYRYKIYAEGFAWSVSLKYILSCGSLTLIITPQYDDFFTRGLVPNKTYWPVARTELCRNIKNAVDWGSVHPVEAEAIGKAGQEFMETLSMERVYDYMYHLISEYAKLQDFRPVPASSSHEVCAESLLCFAEPSKRQFLEQSATVLAISPPCILPGADGRIH